MSSSDEDRAAKSAPVGDSDTDPASLSEQEWQRRLTDQQYQVLRKKGTERAFSGKYVDTEDDGTYVCAACRQPLFESGTKFHSGSGWPSFWEPLADGRVRLEPDSTHGMTRTEVLCARCGSHLGHLFEDGPRPTGLRYCINSVALDFSPDPGE